MAANGSIGASIDHGAMCELEVPFGIIILQNAFSARLDEENTVWSELRLAPVPSNFASEAETTLTI